MPWGEKRRTLQNNYPPGGWNYFPNFDNQPELKDSSFARAPTDGSLNYQDYPIYAPRHGVVDNKGVRGMDGQAGSV